MQSLLITLPLAAVALAAAALVYARRGRRVDDHPVCRRCGFDLFGKPETSTRCAECGADLGRKRAVRVGRRERRVGLARAATAVLVLGAAWVGVVGYAGSQSTAWNRHKPVWWLRLDMGRGDAVARDAATAELLQRIADGRLSTGEVRSAVDAALDYQGDANRPWAAGWGQIVEAAHDAGRISPEQWRRYLKQSIAYRLEVRPRIAAGDVLPMRLHLPPARLASPGRFVIHRSEVVGLSIPGAPVLPYSRASLSSRLGTGAVELTPLPASQLAGLPPGRHVARLSVLHWVGEIGAPLQWVMEEVEVEAGLAVVPPGVDPTRWRTDAGLRNMMAAAVSCGPVIVSPYPSSGGSRPGPPKHKVATAQILVKKAPVTLAFTAVLRTGGPGGRELTLVRGLCPAGETAHFDVMADGEGLASGPAEIVLRPDPFFARRSVDGDVWGEEIVVPNVTVTSW